MSRTRGYDVSLQVATPRAIAAVKARLPKGMVGRVFRTYLDQVYAAARNGAIRLDGQNIFVYREAPDTPDHLDVDFGVGTIETFSPVGNVMCIEVPHGRVATTTHWGDYGALGEAHAAVAGFCRDHQLRRIGPSWEVYGHWSPTAEPRTDVYHLIGD
jgi:effector-binding domain-containing protein